MRFCIKSFLCCNKFRVNMIIIKTEMSVRKINHRVLGLVLPRLSSEACSTKREKIEGKKTEREKGTKRCLSHLSLTTTDGNYSGGGSLQLVSAYCVPGVTVSSSDSVTGSVFTTWYSEMTPVLSGWEKEHRETLNDKIELKLIVIGGMRARRQALGVHA